MAMEDKNDNNNNGFSSSSSSSLSLLAVAVNDDDDDDVPVWNYLYTSSGGIGGEYIFYFNPSDEELIDNYLRRKVMNDLRPDNETIIYRKIVDVNLYKHNPRNLAEKYYLPSREKEWYVFTPRYRKYPNGHRPRRAAGDGYWMAIGSPSQKPILRYNGDTIGFKETLFFYEGKPPNGNKTEWVMDEYVLSGDHINRSSNYMKLDDWVLCRIYKENDESSKNEQDTEPRTTFWTTLKRHLLNLFSKVDSSITSII